MSNATAARFWSAFAPEYFFAPDTSRELMESISKAVGKPAAALTMDDVMSQVKIYAGLKTLIIERDTHCAMPEFRAMLEGTIY